MSIADKITQLTTIRGDIRTALTDKGIAAESHNYSDFASDIADIPSGGGGTDGQFFPMNMLEYVMPVMTMSASAVGQAYDSSITYYTDTACTTEADMSGYSDNDTITDTVYFLI